MDRVLGFFSSRPKKLRTVLQVIYFFVLPVAGDGPPVGGGAGIYHRVAARCAPLASAPVPDDGSRPPAAADPVIVARFAARKK